MMHTLPHKVPADQPQGAMSMYQMPSPRGGELRLMGAPFSEPFGDPPTVAEAAVESPAFYMAKIANTLADIEELMREMMRSMK